MQENAILMDRISKSYSGVLANDNVSIKVACGEIHGLVGENGAGKTTLMNILYGLQRSDSGEIFIYGKKADIHNPQDAIKLGIGMVHQHFFLASSMTVLENIILGNTPTRFGLIDKKSATQVISKLLSQFSIKIDLDSKVYQLSVGQMQWVEIIKCLYRGARILILDEPTAVLTPQETEELFIFLKELAKQGCSIIFITHKLIEVLKLTDNITVMQNGRVTGVRKASTTNKKELANLMVGRDVVLQVEKTVSSPSDSLLSVRTLSANNSRGYPALRNVSFDVRCGEILGIAGVEGNGQTELIEVIAGLREPTTGTIHFNQSDITNATVRQRRDLGMAHIPEDRIAMGVCKTRTIEENLILNKYHSDLLSRGQVLLRKNIELFVSNLISQFNIMTPSAKLAVSSLSGGNMQKVVIAREIEGDPKLLIAAQPTRGVDVGAIEYIHKKIIELRDNNLAILLISSELDEILSLSDRILVMFEGSITASLENENLDVNEIGLYMTGTKRVETH